MLSKKIILFLSLALIAHYGCGWILEGDSVSNWQKIVYWALNYSVAPILALLIVLITPKENKFLRLFTLSVFAIFTAELLETLWCRIPNNETCENSYVSTILVGLIILHVIYRGFLIKYGRE